MAVMLGRSQAFALSQAAGGGGSLCCREAQVAPSNLLDHDLCGWAVAIDGRRVALVSPGADVGVPNSDTGEVSIFLKIGASWIEEAVITPPPGATTINFGRGGISLEGDTLAICAGLDSTMGQYAGACYVYLRSGGTWSLQSSLFASDATAGDFFGSDVRLSGDTLLIGASGDDDLGPDSGSAYLFIRSGNTWSQLAKLTAPDGQPGDGFGSRVDLSGDDLLIGAPSDDDLGTDSGSAYTFVRTSPTTWAFQSKLLAPPPSGANDAFGLSLGLSNGHALIGSQAVNSTVGAKIYHFAKGGTGWTYQSELVPGGAAGIHGVSVDLVGNRAIIGLRGWSWPGPTVLVGRAFVYERSGMSWSLLGSVTRDPGLQGADFAASVAISGDQFVVGSPGEPLPGSLLPAGIGTIFTIVPAPVSFCTGKLTSNGCVPTIGFRGMPSGGGVSGFSVDCTDVNNNTPGVLLYSMGGRANVPFGGGTLCLAGLIRRTIGVNSFGAPAPAANCSGAFTLDWSAFAAGILGGSPAPAARIAGTVVDVQWWGRDSGFAPPFDMCLSDALEFTVCP